MSERCAKLCERQRAATDSSCLYRELRSSSLGCSCTELSCTGPNFVGSQGCADSTEQRPGNLADRTNSEQSYLLSDEVATLHSTVKQSWLAEEGTGLDLGEEIRELEAPAPVELPREVPAEPVPDRETVEV